MDQDRTLLLLSKFVAGEATPEEKEELEWAFLAEPALRQLAALLGGIKEMPPAGMTPEEEQAIMEKGLQRWKQPDTTGPLVPAGRYQGAITPFTQTAPPDREEEIAFRRMPSRRWIAAASVLIIFLSGAALYLHSRPGSVSSANPRETTTKYGARTFIQLPDGSRLWLNAGSKVQYADHFAGNNRELTLSGEAYFDVRHDEQHPFIIHAGKLDVRVLGTSLDVKAYPGDSTIETTLIRGKVEIAVAGDPRAGIVLQPSEKLIINIADIAVRSAIIPDPTDGTIAETAWVENKLVFRKATFAQLAMQLERWYDVKIRFGDSTYLEDEFTGAFKGQSIEDVMRALQITSHFQYRIAGDTIRIW